MGFRFCCAFCVAVSRFRFGLSALRSEFTVSCSGFRVGTACRVLFTTKTPPPPAIPPPGFSWTIRGPSLRIRGSRTIPRPFLTIRHPSRTIRGPSRTIQGPPRRIDHEGPSHTIRTSCPGEFPGWRQGGRAAGPDGGRGRLRGRGRRGHREGPEDPLCSFFSF